MIRIFAMLVGIGLIPPNNALAAAAPAQSIDDDWARVSSCKQLADFKRRHGNNNRYSRFYYKRERNLDCPPRAQPRGQETVSRQTGKGATYVRPRLKDRVVLSIDGSGDATSLADALKVVAEGGTIEVRPGRYLVNDVRISKRVTILGSVVNSLLPTFSSEATGGWTIIVAPGADVTFVDIAVTASKTNVTPLYQSGGQMVLKRSVILWNGAAGTGSNTDGALLVSGGNALIEGSQIGPGQAFALGVIRTAQVNITDGTVSNPGGVGVFVSNGRLEMRGMRVGNTGRPIVAQGTAKVTISALTAYKFTSLIAVGAHGTSDVSLTASTLCSSQTSPFYVESTATLRQSNNFNASGLELGVTNGRTSPISRQRCEELSR